MGGGGVKPVMVELTDPAVSVKRQQTNVWQPRRASSSGAHSVCVVLAALVLFRSRALTNAVWESAAAIVDVGRHDVGVVAAHDE